MNSMATQPHCAFTAASRDLRGVHLLPIHRQTNYRHNRSYNAFPRSQKVPRTPAATTSSPYLSRNPSFPSLSKSELSANFSARRSTRCVSKLHFGRPRAVVSATRHSASAVEALEQATHSSGDDMCMDRILLNFESKFSAVDDYTFLLRELGNRGELSMAMCCFDFAICRESKHKEKGKLASTMISVLGRLGKVDSARKVFEKAVNEGYGDTVYAYSALISAYAKSGYCDDAIRAFETMKYSGLKPNLVTYNALIDACGKGGADFQRALDFFHQMLKDGVQPDKITYNTLLAVCSGAGLWDTACYLFNEMVDKGIDQDIYTYNTLLDVACEAGHMDAAFEIMSEMFHENLRPNEVTYSTLIRGCAKSGELDRAVGLFNETKYAGVKLDTVSYNTLLAIYANLGRLQEALTVAEEMESIGIKKDVVTYNALLDGFGKQGMYDKVKELFQEMRAENLPPNLLTCSTLVSVYSKGGLYHEAAQAYKEFKRQGLKADVVFYSKLIDALCKTGLMESSVSLLDEMMKKGIRPNIFTYNSIINGFGCSAATENPLKSEHYKKSSVSDFASAVVESKSEEKDKDRISKIFEELAAGQSTCASDHNSGKQDFLGVLGILKRMHEMEIKPNVVTFSAIMNACSRCSSFAEASSLLEELRLFDNQVYGVAHGLLMGNDQRIWIEAHSLFDKVKQMGSATASTFYNALADMLWQLGQRRGAQMVVLEGKHRQVWESTFSISELDLHLMSSGAARAMVHVWLLSIHSIVFKGHELPKLLSIMTGWGKHSKVVGDGALKRGIEILLTSMGAPFQISKCNIGRFESKGSVVTAWLRESGTLKILVLQDDRAHQKSTRLEYIPDLQPFPL